MKSIVVLGILFILASSSLFSQENDTLRLVTQPMSEIGVYLGNKKLTNQEFRTLISTNAKSNAAIELFDKFCLEISKKKMSSMIAMGGGLFFALGAVVAAEIALPVVYILMGASVAATGVGWFYMIKGIILNRQCITHYNKALKEYNLGVND